MATSRDAFKERRKEELHVQLRQAYDDLHDTQEVHNATPFGCQRSGKCCQVGLEVHLMECENIARNIQQMCGDDRELLESWIERLEHTFEDESWTWAESVGDQMCAFYEDGCTIYPVRPGICRAYGVVVGPDEFCPRKRPAEGEAYVFAQKETDRLMAALYRTFDNYGRLWPEKDYTVFMPAGVLTFLLPPARLAKLKARTPKKFWRRQKGYRMQFEPSYRLSPKVRTNVEFPFLERYLGTK